LTYYIIVLAVALIGFPILLGALSWLWNKKWRPLQQAKGVPTDKLGNILRRARIFITKEEDGRLLPKVTNPIASKLLRYKSVYLILFLITLALVAVKTAFFILPLFILFFAIYGRTSAVFKKRKVILNRMFEVAASEFRYGRGAEMEPWNYVNIKKWESLVIPGETVVQYPTAFRADQQMSRESFERHFNGTVTDDNTWIYTWKPAQSAVICEPVSHLPTMAPYPGSNDPEWDTFTIGEGTQGPVTFNVSQTPHILVAGTTGSGKSVLQRNLIFHCIQHNDMWRFLGVDVKRVELTPFNKYKKTILGIGANLEDGVEIVRYAKDVMMQRYEEMEGIGVNHFLKLLDENGKPPYAIMLMIDEAFMFMSPEGQKTDEGKVRDQLHGEASTLLGDIARLGRAAGIHLVLATQRPDATVIKGELKANLDIRIAAGRLDSTPSAMVLDSGAATLLPGNVKGRGVIRVGGNVEQFQGYFADQNWIDTWLAKPENRSKEPSLFPDDDQTKLDNDPSRLEIPEESLHLTDEVDEEFEQELADGILEEPIDNQSVSLAKPNLAPATPVPTPVLPTPTVQPTNTSNFVPQSNVVPEKISMETPELVTFNDGEEVEGVESDEDYWKRITATPDEDQPSVSSIEEVVAEVSPETPQEPLVSRPKFPTAPAFPKPPSAPQRPQRPTLADPTEVNKTIPSKPQLDIDYDY